MLEKKDKERSASIFAYLYGVPKRKYKANFINVLSLYGNGRNFTKVFEGLVNEYTKKY